MKSPTVKAAGPVPARALLSAKVVGIPQHKDKLGRVIQLDDFVAYPYSNRLRVGRIIKLNKLMVKVLDITKPSKYQPAEYNKYPHDCVKLDASDMTWYILKNS